MPPSMEATFTVNTTCRRSENTVQAILYRVRNTTSPHRGSFDNEGA